MKPLLLLFFTSLSFYAIAQSSSFSVHGGPAYSFSSAKNIISEHQQLTALNDSVGILTPAIRETSFTIKDRIGFNIGGQGQFKLSNDWSISVGLNLAWSGLNILPSTGAFIPIDGDTTFITINRNSNLLTPNTCTDFETGAPFTDLDFSMELQMLHLQIPVDLTFHISSAIQVSAGLMLSTPLYTQVSNDLFTLNRREERDANGNISIICRNEINRVHDRSGNNFNNSMFHLNLGAVYQISPNISVEARVSRNFNQLFSAPEQSAGFFGSTSVFGIDRMTIYRTALNVRYTFGRQKAEET
jgi:hypothetical protein